MQFPDTIDLCYHVRKMEKFLCHNHNTVELKKPIIVALEKSQREKSFKADLNKVSKWILAHLT